MSQLPRLTARMRRAMHLTLIALIAFAPGLAKTAVAETQCFGRAFSAAYLADARNDALAVVELMLVVETPGQDRPVDAEILVRAMPRDQFGTFVANDGGCIRDPATGRYDCSMACASGGADLVLNDDGSASLIPGRGFALFDKCASPQRTRQVVFGLDDAHAAFQLFPLPPEACPPRDIWAAYGVDR